VLWFILFLCNSLALWNCILVLLCQLHDNYKCKFVSFVVTWQNMHVGTFLLIWFVELEKFKRDFILISLCSLIFLFLFTFFCLFVCLEEKKMGEKLFQFSWFVVFLHYFLCVFLLSLKSLKAIVPNFLEIFTVIDFFVHNILGSLNFNWVLVS